MKFDRLKASIANNASEKPNLYMALCMVESLFEDLEDEAGRELGQCPAGDETLPTRLTWLCRTINGIYRDKSDELTRNRARLDAAMTKLGETEKELHCLADASEQLVSIRKEHDKLKKQLQTAQQAQAEGAVLAERCEQSKQKLQELRSFDVQAAGKELAENEAEIVRLKEKKEELLEKQAAAKRNVAIAQTECCREQETAESCAKKLKTAEAQRDQAKLLAQELERQLQQVALEKTEAEALQEKQKKEKIAAENELSGLMKKNTEFCTAELEPVQALLAAQLQENKQLQEEKAEADALLARKITERDSLILDIGRTRKEQESCTSELEKKKTQLQSLVAEKKKQQDKCNEISEALGALQDQVEELRTKRIPELTDLEEQEEQRKQELKAKADEIEAQLQQLTEATQKLLEEIPALEEKLCVTKATYDKLTAKHTAKSKELEELEHQVQELRDKNEEEKRALYQKQLETNYSELLTIQKKCLELEKENGNLRVALSYEQEKYNGLVADKKKYETNRKELAELLKELAIFATDDYRTEIQSISQRLALLETVRDNLSKAITSVNVALGKEPFSEAVSLEDQMKTQLRNLQSGVEDLYKEVRKCAGSLKLEEL